MNKELEQRIDDLLIEVDELLANDIDTLERTSKLLYRMGAYGNEPEDLAQYENMMHHIDKMKKKYK